MKVGAIAVEEASDGEEIDQPATNREGLSEMEDKVADSQRAQDETPFFQLEGGGSEERSHSLVEMSMQEKAAGSSQLLVEGSSISGTPADKRASAKEIESSGYT